MQTTIKALFNKHTRDSKKESMTFYVKGEDERNNLLQSLHRNVVILRIQGLHSSVTAEYKKIGGDDKKTTLDFEVKGGTSLQSSTEFFSRAGTDVELTITKADESIDEFRDHQKEYRKGLSGKINADGTAEVDPNQVTLNDLLPFEPAEGELDDE